MSILSATNLSKSFGIQDVFWDVNVSVAHGAKIALVGDNGEGKTTLLRILVGLEEPTSGQVTRMKNLRIGYLPQGAELHGAETSWAMCCAVFRELQEMQARLRHLEGLLAGPEGGEATLERYGRLLEAFEHAGGYAYEVRVRTVLSGLGFDEPHMHRPLDQLSGGQRTRALLAKLLLEEPDVLVLDEPTNHLDLQAIEWLEGYLQAWPEALLVVSHDRYFLDKVAHKVWELAFGQLEEYTGNYTKYTELRQDRMARRLAEWEAQQASIAKTEAYIRRYKAGQRSREARGRQTRLERLERLERPREARSIRLRLESDLRSGELVLVTHDLVVGYGKPLLTVPDLELRRLGRAALIGPNGSGKTTLLRTVLGEIPPLSGEARLGTSLRIGYLAQSREDLDPHSTVIDEVTRAKDLLPGQMRNFLARFLFTGDDVFKRIADLSGGEQCRVALAKLTLAEPNFLVLDEPTNQLDIASQEIMEEVLHEFVGTILFVSHDRYLIDVLATQVWLIEGGRLRVYKGSYQEYLSQRQQEQAALREQLAEKAARRQQERPARKQAEQEERTLQDVEEDITYLERVLDELEGALTQASADQDLDRVHALGVEYHQVQADLERLMAEWTVLGEAGE
jgi:ATP-binding cassette subfamily F protein 3